MAEELHEMHDWLKPKNAHSAKGGLSLAAMPSPLAHMYGRDDIVDDIVRVMINPELSFMARAGWERHQLLSRSWRTKQ